MYANSSLLCTSTLFGSESGSDPDSAAVLRKSHPSIWGILEFFGSEIAATAQTVQQQDLWALSKMNQ